MSRGTYERTPEIRARNRESATAPLPCEPDCTCRRHTNRGGGRPCEPGCDCLKHHRTKEHNRRISESVRATIRGRR